MTQGSVVVISGGVGGAKLVLGLSRHLRGDALTVIANSGDDFEHFGLTISPDLDTTLYTLADLVHPEQGWGRRGETWTFMNVVETLGGETWFRLGDGDLALHVERTRRLAAGEPLSAIMADVARRFGVTAQVLPMSDQRVRTVVETDEGPLGFQHYFVRRQSAPCIRAVRFDGAETAKPAPGALERLSARGTDAIIIAPSNPYLSIDPILSVPGYRAVLRTAEAPVIAVSPIVAGKAIKGPTAKIMAELGLPVSPLAIARHYEGLIDGFVLDARDAALAPQFDLPLAVIDTVMTTLEDKRRVAKETLDFAATLPRRARAGAAAS